MVFLRQNLSGSELLFKRLPKIFSEDLKAAAEKIIAAKKFFDGAVSELEGFILVETKKIFSTTGNLAAALQTWCASLDKEISEQLFSDDTDKFLSLVKSAGDEKILVEKLARLTTGLRRQLQKSSAEMKFQNNKIGRKNIKAAGARRNFTAREVALQPNYKCARFDGASNSGAGKKASTHGNFTRNFLRIKKMAYFDNAATTFPKPDCVYSFMEKFYRMSGGNSGRGIYALANSAESNLLRQLLNCGSKIFFNFFCPEVC